MNKPYYVIATLLCFIAICCNAKISQTKAPDADSKSLSTLASPPAREVNRYEFIETELVQHPEDEQQLNHNYMGSSEGFDYIAVRGNRYKIPSDQLNLERFFPVTEDSSKWIPLRIHFSQVIYDLN